VAWVTSALAGAATTGSNIVTNAKAITHLVIFGNLLIQTSLVFIFLRLETENAKLQLYRPAQRLHYSCLSRCLAASRQNCYSSRIKNPGSMA
jgi:hypothetical protein